MLREQRIQHHIVLVLGIAENVGRGRSDGTELDNQRVPIEKKDDERRVEHVFESRQLAEIWNAGGIVFYFEL